MSDVQRDINDQENNGESSDTVESSEDESEWMKRMEPLVISAMDHLSQKAKEKERKMKLKQDEKKTSKSRRK